MQIIKFKRPKGTGQKPPSEALSRAMHLFADADEFQPLLREATEEGKSLSIDVYQDRAGRPILVHFSVERLD